MKRVIRKNVWDTNSSTTHSCVILPEDLYKKWEEGDYYLWDDWAYIFADGETGDPPKEGCVYTKEEADEFIKKSKYGYSNKEEYDDEDRYYADNGFVSYDRFSDDEYLEFDTTYYTSPSGDKLVITCKYGTDC